MSKESTPELALFDGTNKAKYKPFADAAERQFRKALGQDAVKWSEGDVDDIRRNHLDIECAMEFNRI